MDLKRIFIDNASPTKVGGQAILEGLMMRGSRALSVAVREPSGDIHLTVQPLPAPPKWKKIPVVRGVVSFISSLATGMRVLTYGAEVLENAPDSQYVSEEPGRFEQWLNKKFGEKAAENFAVIMAVILSIVMVVGIFVLLPTVVVSLANKAGINSPLLLNLIEGVLRIAVFILYVALITKIPDIRRTFQYHGAEHKTIHCFENKLELTPENAQTFYTLHPRCGTSFLMFVMVISLLVFSFLGWPNLVVRLVSRILLIPVIAGLSYEVLQFTGRHSSKFVQIMSLPGIMLQKLTTKEPDMQQLEVAITALKAVLPSQEDPDEKVEYWVGRVKADGSFVKDEAETLEYIRKYGSGEAYAEASARAEAGADTEIEKVE